MLGPANTDAINQVGRLSYGEATGVTQTVRNFGASFGLAALGTLLVTVERTRLTNRLVGLGLPARTAHKTAQAIASNRQSKPPSGVSGATAAHVFHAAALSVADGMQAVLYGMAGVMAVAAIVARVGLRRGIHAAPDAMQADAEVLAREDQPPSRPAR
jgi:hypothetical protein